MRDTESATARLRAAGATLAIAAILAGGIAWSGCGGDDDNTSSETNKAKTEVEEGAKKAEEGLKEGGEQAKKGIEEGAKKAEKGLEEGKTQAEKGVEEAKKQVEKYSP